MNLGIIGAGYVGLTTGICLAMQNHSIIVYDIDSNKINTIKNSSLPFFEKGLEEKLQITKFLYNISSDCNSYDI